MSFCYSYSSTHVHPQSHLHDCKWDRTEKNVLFFSQNQLGIAIFAHGFKFIFVQTKDGLSTVHVLHLYFFLHKVYNRPGLYCNTTQSCCEILLNFNMQNLKNTFSTEKILQQLYSDSSCFRQFV